MKRRKKISKKSKILDKKLIFSTVIIAIVVGGLVYYKVFLQTPPEIKFSLKAAIIDQLGTDVPNSEFNNTVTDLLVRAGFNVFYHRSENITVDFCRGIAQYNYGLIILRAHSALREGQTTVDIFTSENYTEALANEYRAKYGSRLLVRGEYLWHPGKFYFAITSDFIERLDGYFPKSIVIAMGCWSIKPPKPGWGGMAEAFIKKGAKAYIGWTDLVYPQDTDNETINLLSMLLIENKPLGDAISKTKSYLTEFNNTFVTTRLDFYPKSAGNLTISELIKEARASTTLQSTVDSFKPLLPLFCAANVINYKSKDFKIYNKEKEKH